MSDKTKTEILKGKLDPAKISIVDFKIIKGQIDSPEDFNNNDVTGHNFTADFSLAFNLVDKLVKADFNIDIETKSKKENKIESKGSFHFIFIYKVENLNELVTVKKENSIDLNGGLGNALASITHSTSRGILLTRLQGTTLHNFILPIINPNDLLK
ncbi:MAG TPA: hypothetical protein PLC65_16245 [Bacteroidia bacterium]|nr:hypothetical protein [Bacteroidia bacterium]